MPHGSTSLTWPGDSAFFGRLGSRPFTRAEMERMFLREGKLFRVAKTAPGEPQEFILPPSATEEGGEVGVPAVQPAAPRQERRLPGRR